MLDILLSNMHQGKARKLPDWQRLLSKLKVNREFYGKRFATYETVESGAVRLLYNMLYDVPTRYLLGLEDDVERYFKSIKFMTDLPQKFDTVERKGPSSGVFFPDQSGTDELLVSTSVEPFSNMPFGAEWNTWQTSRVEPVTILCDNAPKPPEELEGDVISHPQQPEYAVIGINIPLLVLKWIRYIEVRGESAIEDPRDFIHNHVIWPLWEQTTDQWILNIILSLVREENVEHVVEKHTPSWGIDNVFEQGVEDLDKFLALLRRRKIDVSDAASTDLFLCGSMLDYMDLHRTYASVRDSRQYLYIKYLSQSRFILTLLHMYFMQSETGESDRVVKQLSKKIRQYNRSNPENMAFSRSVKFDLELLVETIDHMLALM